MFTWNPNVYLNWVLNDRRFLTRIVINRRKYSCRSSTSDQFLQIFLVRSISFQVIHEKQNNFIYQRYNLVFGGPNVQTQTNVPWYLSNVKRNGSNLSSKSDRGINQSKINMFVKDFLVVFPSFLLKSSLDIVLIELVRDVYSRGKVVDFICIC